jgi:hypothetical protein
MGLSPVQGVRPTVSKIRNFRLILKGKRSETSVTGSYVYARKLDRSDDRAIAQSVSRRIPTAAARVQIRVWSCEIL